MRRSLAVMMMLLTASTASAQLAKPAGLPTVWTVLNKSLAQLLDEGFTIDSIGGASGEVLLLRSEHKWVRCELDAGDYKPAYLKSIKSICWALNDAAAK